MSPQRLTWIVAKIKYQVNVEMNEISINNSVCFLKIPDIFFISIKDKLNIISLLSRWTKIFSSTLRFFFNL